MAPRSGAERPKTASDLRERAPPGIRTQNLRSLRPQFADVRMRSKRPAVTGFFVHRGSQPSAVVRGPWLPIWLPESASVCATHVTGGAKLGKDMTCRRPNSGAFMRSRLARRGE